MTRRPIFAGAAGREPTQEGVAFLVIVVAISLVMAVLAATLFHVAVDNISTSSRMVQKDQALQAAEAGIDRAYQTIESASSLATMPCGPISGTLGGLPSPSTFTVAITYYSTLSAQETIDCTPTNLAHANGVQLEATGQDAAQTAKVESEANIATPDRTSVFHESVFVNGGLNLGGGGSFEGGNNNIYLNGTLTCQGGASVDGSVVVFGQVKTKGGCSIAGELTATTSITIGGTAVIGGTVTSTCPPTTCSVGITVSGTPTVSGSMYAKSAIDTPTSSWLATYQALHAVTLGGTTTYVQYTINANETSLSTPKKQTFPTFFWNPSTVDGWAGPPYDYTVVTTLTCSALKTFLKTTVPAATTNIAIFTACAVTLPSMKLAHSLAVFTTTSILVKNTSTITATSPVTLYLVVPTTSSKTCGSSATITIRGSISSTVATFVYALCHVKIAGTGNIQSGKIYAGAQLTIDGSITIASATFTPPGKHAVPSSPVLGLIYERQIP